MSCLYTFLLMSTQCLLALGIFRNVPIMRYFCCFAPIYNETTILNLCCDTNLRCELFLFEDINQEQVTAEGMPDIEILTDNCSVVANNFNWPEDVDDKLFSLSNGKYRPYHNKIQMLYITMLNFTLIPHSYFCKMTSMVDLTISQFQNLFKDHQCIVTDHYYCNVLSIENLTLFYSSPGFFTKDSFCRVPKLKILRLQCKLLGIEENAFLYLKNLSELHISHTGLIIIPTNAFQTLDNLKVLSLALLSLTSLSQDFFHTISHLSKLRVLRLNQIRFSNSDGHVDNSTKLHKGSFGQLKKLEIIKITGSNINHIDDFIFDSLGLLNEVDLRGNHLQILPDNALHKNNNILSLNLSNNTFRSIPKTNSASLENLDMSRNHIANITNADAKNLCEMTNLKTLNLQDNKIQSIVPHAFRCNKHLYSFNLNGNLIKSIHSIFRYTRLEFLNLEDNALDSFSFSDFPDELTDLYLAQNQISHFPVQYEVLDRPMQLKHLDVSHNNLVNLTSIVLPPTLHLLKLSDNKIEAFSFRNNISHNLDIIPPSLKIIDLNNNSLQITCPLLINVFHELGAITLDLDHNPLMCKCEISLLGTVYQTGLKISGSTTITNHTCDSEFEDTETRQQIKTENLQKRNLFFECILENVKGCQCNTHINYSSICNLPCPESCGCYITSHFRGYFMDCNRRHLNQIPMLFLQSKMFIILEFSVNQIQEIVSNAFVNVPFVTELYLQDNSLRKIAPDAFKDVPNLKILNLEYNFIMELPSSIFSHLTKLTELNLANNFLTHLPYDIYQHWPSPNNPSAPSYFKLHNPWKCDCNYLKAFQQWLQKFAPSVKDLSDLSCTTNDNPPTSFPLLSYSCHTEVESGDTMAIWASTFGVLAFFLMTVILMYAYRHEMQVVIYSRTGVRLFHQKETIAVHKMYDAFIAYNEEDAEFVARQLVPGLERIQRPYKLCIHHRDFLVGLPIMESIQSAVEHSHRTIVILSESFVASGWCLFEFKTAHNQMISDPHHKVIVIVLNDVPKDVGSEVRLYLRTHTYLRWDDRLFWRKLYYAMPERPTAETPL